MDPAQVFARLTGRPPRTGGPRPPVVDAGLGEVTDRYRQSVAVELAFAVSYLVIGVFGLLVGDDVGRAFGVAVLGLAVPFAVAAGLKVRRHLYLCTNGLLTVAGGGRVTGRLTWEEVAHIRIWTTRFYQAGSVDDVQRCVLELRDGRRWNLARPPYARAEQLVAAVEARVAEVGRPRRIAQLARTGATSFGPITVTADGVHDGGRFVRWSEIARVTRGRVRLRVWAGARRPAVSRRIRSLPDVAVLMSLVSMHLEIHRR